MGAFDETWSLLLLKHSITKENPSSKQMMDEANQGENKVTFPDINDASPEEMMENNSNAVSSTGRLPGEEPPPQSANPLKLSVERLKELQGGQ